MFKRPRLSPPYTIVNASLAAIMVFLAACSGDTADKAENPHKNNTPAIDAENAIPVSLQAVWATPPLKDSITSLAFVGGSSPILAASLENGTLQFFDMQGDRITAPLDLGVKTLATGQAVNVDGIALTLFPGIGTDGDLNFYAFAHALGDPIKFNFLSGVNAAGLCAGPPLDDTAILQLAYWTNDNPEQILHGHVIQDESQELIWRAIDTKASKNGPITACLADAELQIATASEAINLAALTKFGQRFVFAQGQNGNLRVSDQNGMTRPVTISNGITVRAPNPPSAMAILSNVQFGNYPDGLLVLGGPVDGTAQITLIEPGNLLRKPR